MPGSDLSARRVPPPPVAPLARKLTLLLVGFALLVGVFLLAGGLALEGNRQNERVAYSIEVSADVSRVVNALVEAENGQRGYVLSGKRTYRDLYERSARQVPSAFARLSEFVAKNQRQSAMLVKARPLVHAQLDELARTVALVDAGRADAALAQLNTDRSKALLDQARAAVDAVRIAEREMLAARQKAAVVTGQWLLVAIALSILVASILAGILFRLLVREARALSAANEQIRAMNAGLEERIIARTADLESARARAEMLLREVNHRVANSLSLVASLAQLQAMGLRSKPARDALAEVQTRIRAVAAVHRALYVNDSVESVALDAYLAKLTEELSANRRVTLRATPVDITPDRAIAIGVIVNELVSNAQKYAYPADQDGTIGVTLERNRDGMLELCVADDGAGWTGTGKVQGTGLGTQIVEAMTLQLDGEFAYDTAGRGTLARLRCPVD